MALSKAKLFAHRFPHISIATESKLVTCCFYIPKKIPEIPMFDDDITDSDVT
jgi:hypothetical protein